MDELERRSAEAIAAIRRELNSGESAVTRFVSHHIEEIDEAFWLKHCGTVQPQASQVLDLLVLDSHWSEEDDESDADEEDEDGMDHFDFTLPGDVTNYLISVEFDDSGKVASVTMES